MRTRILSGFLCLFCAAAVHAEPVLLTCSFNPADSEADIADALGGYGDITAVVRLNPVDDGRGVAVFKVSFGKEGARIQSARTLGRAGLIGFPVDTPSECALDFALRSDTVALASNAAEALDVTADAATEQYLKRRKRMEEIEAQLGARIAEQNTAQTAYDDANAKALVAHELAHTVQQRATNAVTAAKKSPTLANIAAALNALLDLQKVTRDDAIATEVAAQKGAVLQAATKAAALAGQEAAQGASDLKQAQADATAATAAADAARTHAGTLINEEIVAAADQVAADADDIASALDRTRDAIGAPKKSFASKLSRAAVAALDEVEAAVEDATALASIDAGNARALAAEARKLPPIAHVNTEAEVAKSLQWQLIDRIAAAGDNNAVNAFVLGAGVVGGSPINAAAIRVALILNTDCVTGDCGDLTAVTSDMGELQLMTLQMHMQNENQQFTTVSNVLKTKHDTVKNSINNVR